MTGDLLTEKEREVIDLLGRCASGFGKIVGDGPTRAADVNEFVHHIHACQQQVMSQAAGRAYPKTYRLLGETLKEPS